MKQNSIPSAGTAADSEQMLMFERPAPIAVNHLLVAAVVDKGAAFSDCKQYRYQLWRIWDKSLPLVMFIGLNPSTANEAKNDPTIESVIRLSKFNGYGGFYMMNCFAFITAYPEFLKNGFSKFHDDQNEFYLRQTGKLVKDVVFAWGGFKEPSFYGMDRQLKEMFPNPKCILKNKDGSPSHPMYKKGTIKFIDW